MPDSTGPSIVLRGITQQTYAVAAGEWRARSAGERLFRQHARTGGRVCARIRQRAAWVGRHDALHQDNVELFLTVLRFNLQ